MNIKTLSEAIKFYADPDNCIEVVKEMRWMDGKPVCRIAAINATTG